MVVARLSILVRSRRETNMRAIYEAQGDNSPGVTAVRPEAKRAILGQIEADIPVRGGSMGYCEHAFPRAEDRSKMLIVFGDSWFLPNLA